MRENKLNRDQQSIDRIVKIAYYTVD